MNQQQIFDRVWTHLNAQGVASMSARGSCAYQGVNGTSCAVGCLLTAEALAGCPEDVSVRRLNRDGVTFDELDRVRLRRALTLSGFDVQDRSQMNFLIDMQRLHDEHLAANVPGCRPRTGALDDWRGQMRKCAAAWGLTVPA